jgi:diguanylate cyclase (GGDEF)-like protein/PAS domain S-box-containing protein
VAGISAGQFAHREVTVSDHVAVLPSQAGDDSLGMTEEAADLCRAILDSAGCLMLILDEAGRVLRWNQACQELTGLSAEEAGSVDLIVDRCVPAEEGPAVREGLAELAGGAGVVTGVSRWRGRTGRLHLLTWSNVRMKVGGQTLLVCTGIEITDDTAVRTALQLSEERFRLLAESIPDLVYRYRFTPHRHFEYVNPACLRFTGYTAQELYAGAELGPELFGVSLPMLGDRHLTGPPAPLLVRWERRDASMMWLEHRMSGIRDAEGRVVGVQGIVADVTERVLAERIAEAQARVLELVARGTPLGRTQASALEVIEVELPGTIAVLIEGGERPRQSRVVAAPAVPAAIGASCPPTLRSHLDRLSARSCGDDASAVPGLPGPLRAMAVEQAARHAWAVPVDAAEPGLWGHVLVLAGHPPSGERELGVLRTAARLIAVAVERDRAQHALARLALHDSLTGLANRAFAINQLQAALDRGAQRPAARKAGGRERLVSQEAPARRALHWSSGRTVAVLFCDLDRFKTVNDSLGHSAGDALLVAVAERLRSAVGGDDVVARTGGDEFTVIHEGSEGVAGAMAAAHRLVAAMEAPFRLRGRRVYAALSVGVAVAGHGATAEALIRDADAAMYRAKERGGRRAELFDIIMQVRARERLELETGLHGALARRELTVRYQPQVLLGSGRVVGAEALLRWEHGGRSVPPGEFVPVAEETGLIVPIGAWVLEKACQAGARMASQVPGFQVAVNLSARQLGDPELTEHVSRALAVSGLDAGQLCLEVTETALMDDAPAAVATLAALHELGVTFAIDDFGTGYSSLLYLKRLPVSVLKIDGTFVRGLGRNPDDEAIVASIIQLGHALGRRVIGEGVETAAQHAHLEALGCSLGQGYRFGRAGSLEDLRDLPSR